MNLEKYKQLYEYAKEVYQEELRRFDLITHKATQYLSVLSVLLGLGIVFGKWLVSNLLPPGSPIAYIALFFSLLLYLSLLCAWAVNFQILRGGSLEKMPLNDVVIKFFDENTQVDIYYAYAKRLKDAHQNNLIQINKRANLLVWGHRAILLSVMLIVVLSFLGMYCYGNGIEIKGRKEAHMSEKGQKASAAEPSTLVSPPESAPQGQQPIQAPIVPSDPKPNPNIVAPAFDIVTHSEFNLGQKAIVDSTKINQTGSVVAKPDSQLKK